MFCPECGNYAANKALRELGVKDESRVFTYDGNPDGKETYDNGGTVAIRVGDSIDPADIKKIVGVLAGQEMEILAGQWSITQVVDGVISLVANDISFVIIAAGDNALGISPGTYASQNDNYYVSRIETETIHPIDQKYLPGGSIRMDAYGNSEMTVNDALLNLALEGGGTTTFASGMEPFWADVLAKQPDYLIFNVGDNLRMPICVLYATEGSVQSGESCISANGLLSLYGTNLMGYFVMAQTKDGKGVKISVKSENVIFPETALAEHGGE